VVGGDQGVQVGQPTVPGARVTATVLGESKGPKIVVRKFKRRKGYRRKQGHRQRYLRIRIDRIEA
ncbi:MAG: 50S ribosomal protein L21, partial [Planctomycetota bacterium]